MRAYLSLLPMFLVALTGCAGTAKSLDMGGEDGSKVAALVEDSNDAKGNPKKMDAIFTRGTKPADAKKFAKCSYYVAGKPTVSGTAATCKVRVDGPSGETLGEQEWTFTKDGDRWKIASAPLP